jgi:hypothetical protein
VQYSASAVCSLCSSTWLSSTLHDISHHISAVYFKFNSVTPTPPLGSGVCFKSAQRLTRVRGSWCLYCGQRHCAVDRQAHALGFALYIHCICYLRPHAAWAARPRTTPPPPERRSCIEIFRTWVAAWLGMVLAFCGILGGAVLHHMGSGHESE